MDECMDNCTAILTHAEIDTVLCGTPREIGHNYSIVDFTATDAMKADSMGLVHGGFIFGLADYAAMIAVNHPHVVLASAEVTFQKPAAVGDKLVARAVIAATKGKKRDVTVEITRNGEIVFKGTFICAVLDKHVMTGR
ncbi:MAG TPA: hotdog domain-containing protein [Spirochaetota bacterium]|nr:hotdog domain-containing protein [Spirochaetota bacterium]